jgi:hypothetical protein
MKEITHDDLCSMKLHEFSYLPGPENGSVQRVPGGWIYTLSLYDPAKGAYVALSSCFVPYTNVDSARTDGAEVVR